MNITRTSSLSGVTRTLDIPITESEHYWLSNPCRPPIQELLPHLTADQREFLISGITPEEWDNAFGPTDAENLPESPVQTSNTTTSDEQDV